MTQEHLTIPEQFACRQCGGAVALELSPGNELYYVCQSPRCQKAVSVDCPEALAVWPEAASWSSAPARTFSVERGDGYMQIVIRDERGNTSAVYRGAGEPAGERRIERLRDAGYTEVAPDGDDESDEPAPHDPHEERAPLGQRLARARAKAEYHLAGGLDIRQVDTYAYLVPSGTRGGVIHRVDQGVCSCEAGAAGKVCWHVEAVNALCRQVAA